MSERAVLGKHMQSYAERGLFLFTYGTDSLADFLHTDNFVQAHIKAAETLLGEDPVTVCGETNIGSFILDCTG